MVQARGHEQNRGPEWRRSFMRRKNETLTSLLDLIAIKRHIVRRLSNSTYNAVMKRSLISLILLCSACALSYAHSTANVATINITIVRPAAGAAAGSILKVAVGINSTFEVKSVKASVEGREAALVFPTALSCGPFGCSEGWGGDISLSGLSRGQKTLTVIATDVFGNTSQTQGTFVYDQPPALNIAAPLAETVARPAIFVDVTCTDDDPVGCVSLTVSFDQDTLATGKDAVKGHIFLPASGVWSGDLTFTARDSIGQTTKLTRHFLIETSINLSEVASVGGLILDVQSDRILFREDNSLKIRDRTSGLDTVVMNDSAKFPSYGFLAPKGLIFVASSEPGFSVYNWRDGNLDNLGFLDSSSSLKVKGKYALWNVSNSLILRDLDSGTNTQVSTIAGNWQNDVSASGDVVYWSSDSPTNYNIYRYRGGATTKLTNDSTLRNTYPLTDGINVAYRKNNAIMLYGSAGEVTLSAPSWEVNPGSDYQLNGGWVAFTRPGNIVPMQVWTRSPAGEEAQISFFSSSSFIKALSPVGSVIFNNHHGRSYLKEANTPDNAPSVDVGTDQDNYFWQDGQWFVFVGRSLFRVNTTPQVPTLLTEAGSQQVIALNAVTWVRSPFSTITTQNLSSDQRTRVALLAANVSLLPGDNTAAITVQAEDSQHRLYSLPVEYVGKVPNFDWLTQINVTLPEELRGAGNVWLSMTVRGEFSNRMMINIQ